MKWLSIVQIVAGIMSREVKTVVDVDHDCLENLEEHPREVEVWCEETVQVRKKCTVCGHEIHELYDIAAFYDETEGRWIKRRE
ncbi:hypothetical protein AKJ47_01185 [candidate division MSBL1 archaeon SCGC-AAA261G05]|uniref:Uncharacterized protein n=3 Tax=candidate division MSBL1 TaxID=215777 RepID=A0A133V0C4_9EURY|nr:hypothetical protein AKJ42_02300 [candidate division MSBL1 archaeon SCGC-AAA261C02]KXB03995.1 hypothetical protein AKJ47_01185 [candidate division MSBL1 archaeon SCGC-AAA261G05]KXB04846.1 hypothetical protein AKJ48_01180 [candidate division MSBL1 archaeon SCGC-AAA261O19]